MFKLLGYKCGMSQCYQDRKVIPITLIYVPDNIITQIKDISVQHAIPVLSSNKNITKPLAGHLQTSGIIAKSHIRESKLNNLDTKNYSVGDKIKLDIFTVNDAVDLTAICKGKGFAGPVKRWGFRMQPASHGNSLSHRTHGSTGAQDTGRVWKGKHMAGHLGYSQKTVQNLRIISIDLQNKLVAVKGCVPGVKGSLVRIAHTVRTKSCKQ